MPTLPPPFETISADLKEYLKSKLKDQSTKISKDAFKAVLVYLDLFLEEAMLRASNVCRAEGQAVVDLVHLEKILAQLLLDF